MTTLLSAASAVPVITKDARSSRVQLAGLWTLQIASAGMFLFVGTLKLAGGPDLVSLFDAIGIGQWFRYLTGTIEVVSAVLLLVPTLAFYGALLLVPTMVGAVITHLFIVGGSPLPATLFLLATATIAWVRRP
jgi:putative oxidoreductase